MAGHRLASDRAGDVSGRPRSDTDILQAHVPPDRSTRIETVCRPPDRTIGRTSSGHYPFCGTIYRIAETCLRWPSILSFVAKRYAGYTKPVRVKVRDGLSPAPAFAHPASRLFQSTRIKTAHFHGSAMPYRSLCADIILSGITFPSFYFFSFRCRHQRGSRDDYVFTGFLTGGAILSQGVPLTSGSVWVA